MRQKCLRKPLIERWKDIALFSSNFKIHKMKVKKLTVESVRYIAFEMAKAFSDEPIPDFYTRYKGKLESCLAQPFQAIGGKDLYPSFTDKATMLFYLLVKNHPFLDGNKRIAVMTLSSFLIINGYFLNTTERKLYNLAIKTAKSRMKERDKILREIKSFLEENIIK